ncbi:MAG: ChbG/HpnK family deacetylase [Stappiaceae bacterium]
MKRVILTSLEYGLAFGVDRALRDLAAGGRISAIGCLVTSELWPLEAQALRQSIEEGQGRTRAGVAITLSYPFEPASEEGKVTFGNPFPKPLKSRLQGVLRQHPKESVRAEIGAQLALFAEHFGREPDFVTLHFDTPLTARIAKALTESMVERSMNKVLILAPLSGTRADHILSRRAASRHLTATDGILYWPRTEEIDELRQFVVGTMSEQPDNVVAVCFPGEVDDRLRRFESKKMQSVRSAHLDFLNSDLFLSLQDERGIFLF